MNLLLINASLSNPGYISNKAKIVTVQGNSDN